MNHRQPLRLAALATVGLLVLAAIPAAALPRATASPDAVLDWWEVTGPGAAMALVRLVAMAYLTYVATVSVLYTVAEAVRLPWLRRLALLAASPGLRKHLSAGALTLAIAAAPATAVGQAATDDSSIVLVDVGAVSSGQPAVITPEPILLIDAGPTVIEPSAHAHRNVTPPGPHAGGFGRYEVAATPDAWVVEAGDHLWHIAERTLEAAAHPTDEATVTAYWTRLIAANTAALDGDPDIIHVGQVITLPPVGQG